nr:hypothetical protein [Tanacetum cinerariifolium]
MSTQQDIYAAGSESRPPMLNKENYVPWPSRLFRYTKSRPNGKLIHNSILNGPYVRRMIPEPGDANREVTVTETFHVQTDDGLSDKELKQIKADDQAIQTILIILYDGNDKNAVQLQDAIRIANNLMDQMKGYARSAENKRRLDNNPRHNHGQQPDFKRQNVRGWNVARAYTARNNKKKGDCMIAVALNTQRAPVRNQSGVVCYECGRPRHYRKNFPKLRNQNRGNKTRNKTRSNKATTKDYAIGGGGANHDSNVVTGMFLLNNCYACMLFDSGADRSFVSSTFSTFLDVAPPTLDTSYTVEIADGRILETNVVFRRCTLGLLGIYQESKFRDLSCPKIKVKIHEKCKVIKLRGQICQFCRVSSQGPILPKAQSFIIKGCQKLEGPEV